MIFLIFACSTEEAGILHPTSELYSASMISITASSYAMGYPDTEPGPYGNHWKETAQPQHTVNISAFEIDQYEVTVSDYSYFLSHLYSQHPEAARPHSHPLQPIILDEYGSFQPLEGEANRPMRYVSWYDAATFCAFRGKRLPTEAEWELVAKGSDIENPRAFPWSPDGGASCQKAVYYTNRTLCEEHPAEVGSRSPQGDTPDGVADIAGNVSEWVFDWFDTYSAEEATDPTGPSQGKYKVLRGGGFRETSDALRSTDRVAADPLSRSEGIGFRCARSLQ